MPFIGAFPPVAAFHTMLIEVIPHFVIKIRRRVWEAWNYQVVSLKCCDYVVVYVHVKKPARQQVPKEVSPL